MQPFEKHIFICTNKRPEGHPRGCCALNGGEALKTAFKKAVVQRGLKGRVRANAAGCLDACELGATVVIYPEGIWYLGVTVEDVDEILEESILKNGLVDRLLAGPEDWERLIKLRQAGSSAILDMTEI